MYFDNCGKLMTVAEDEFGILPLEAKPSGAKMTVPDRGIQIFLDTTELRVSQDQPRDDGLAFKEICSIMAKLVAIHIAPKLVENTGLLRRHFWQLGSLEKSFARTLTIMEEKESPLADVVQMPSLFKVTQRSFQSGSYDFHFKIEPVNFEQLVRQKFTISHGSTSTQKKRIEGLNKYNEDLNVDLDYGLMLDADLIEHNPAKNSLEKHFALSKSKADAVLRYFSQI